VSERAHGLGGEHAGVHGVLEAEADQAEPVAGVDLPPLLPAEHGWSVQQRDAHHGGVGAGVEEGAHAGDDQLPRILDPGDARADVGHQSPLELLVDGAEEVALVGEVVVEGAPGDTGTGDDLLGADAGKAALGEELTADPQKRVAGGVSARRASPLGLRGRPLALRAAPLPPGHTVCMLRHTTCMEGAS
jgi:hypothetical protein